MTTTTCRKCGNRVFSKELFCPDCGVSVAGGKKPLLAGMLLVVIVACSAWVGWHLAFGEVASDAIVHDERSEAWYAALEVCWEFLGSAAEAEFPSYGEEGTGVSLRDDGMFDVAGYVDVPGESGESERRSWEVQLRLTGDLWRAEYLLLGDREFSVSGIDEETAGEKELADIERRMAIYDVARRFAGGLGGPYEAVVSAFDDEDAFIDPVAPGEYDAYGRLEIPERGPGAAVWMGRVETESTGSLALKWMDVQGFGRYSPEGATVIRGLEERPAVEGQEEGSIAPERSEEVNAPRQVRLVVGRDVELSRDGQTVVESIEAGAEIAVLESNEGILTITYRGGQGKIPVAFTDWQE